MHNKDLEKMYSSFRITEEMSTTFKKLSAINNGVKDDLSNYRISTVVLAADGTGLTTEGEANAELVRAVKGN